MMITLKFSQSRQCGLGPKASRAIGAGLGIALIGMLTVGTAIAIPDADVPFTRSASGAMVRHIPGGVTARSRWAGISTRSHVSQGTSHAGGIVTHRNPQFFMRVVKAKPVETKPAQAKSAQAKPAKAQKH